MSYKLMRYINSAAFTLSTRVDSIHHAIVYLGEKEIKRWATLITLTGIDDKPDELITTSLIRGKMCELISATTNLPNKDSAFIVGMFSTLDAMMDQPLQDILGALPLNPDILAALLNRKGPYAMILDSVLAYERGEWDRLQPDVTDVDIIADNYLRSLEWADAIMRDIKTELH
jgi:EAL and modified HD-GYP domain-containing signal transduction protein